MDENNTDVWEEDFGDHQRCLCADRRWDFHGCPYAQELGDTEEERSKECRCCPYCTNQCAMDV